MFLISSFSSSVRLRKGSSLKKTEETVDTKKGQKLIEKETMETGQVISVLNQPISKGLK